MAIRAIVSVVKTTSLRVFGRTQDAQVVAGNTRTSQDGASACPFDKRNLLGYRGIRDLVEGPSKFGDSGGRLYHVIRKDAAPQLKGRSILSCSVVGTPIYLDIAPCAKYWEYPVSYLGVPMEVRPTGDHREYPAVSFYEWGTH